MTESEKAEMSSWDKTNRGEKLGLVWRNRKNISQIINDYLCLPFFLLIILWERDKKGRTKDTPNIPRADSVKGYEQSGLLNENENENGWKKRKNIKERKMSGLLRVTLV